MACRYKGSGGRDNVLVKKKVASRPARSTPAASVCTVRRHARGDILDSTTSIPTRGFALARVRLATRESGRPGSPGSSLCSALRWPVPCGTQRHPRTPRDRQPKDSRSTRTACLAQLGALGCFRSDTGAEHNFSAGCGLVVGRGRGLADDCCPAGGRGVFFEPCSLSQPTTVLPSAGTPTARNPLSRVGPPVKVAPLYPLTQSLGTKRRGLSQS